MFCNVMREYLGNGLKGNRIIPVGSGRIHCEPPTDYTPTEGRTNRKSSSLSGVFAYVA